MVITLVIIVWSPLDSKINITFVSIRFIKTKTFYLAESVKNTHEYCS